jgi:glycosyltransferase involved in cell wall biosynthesis
VSPAKKTNKKKGPHNIRQLTKTIRIGFRKSETLQRIVKNLKQSQHADLSKLQNEVKKISSEQGIQAAYNYLLQAEVMLDIRKPRIAIYDHAFHFIGGAQKYGLSLISVLQDEFDITIIANKEVNLRDFFRWYNLDLSKCRIKILKLPFYEKRNVEHLDPACISKETGNPFHLISRESGNYDIFINNSMNEMVYPLSNISILICHFPERRPKTFFYADYYTSVIYNSRYTEEWIRRKWKFSPHQHIYPPVDMEIAEENSLKEKIILSVARFEPEGTKRQLEMIEAFLNLKKAYPKIMKEWRFILAGGSNPNNPYLSRLKRIMAKNPDTDIELKINAAGQEIKSLYRDSVLFWHLCGLTHNDPAEIEHFGMTIVEAMQNRMVPIVFDGGGPREIVDNGKNGFRVKSKAELMDYSLLLFTDETFFKRLAENAQKKSRIFSRKIFEKKVRSYFDEILKMYLLPGAN